MISKNITSLKTRLIKASREIGREERQLAILAEGNVSAYAGNNTFWIKSSGCSLKTLDSNGVSLIDMVPILKALENSTLSDDAVRQVLTASRVHAKAKVPSIETFLHAVCLKETGATWIGHCHTVSVLHILCSKLGADPFRRHIFPDAIVMCGRHVCVVPYMDPGFSLALAVRSSLKEFFTKHGVWPKVVLLSNHGPVALAGSEQEMFGILLMLDKWARVLAGTYPLGGPLHLPDAVSSRIDTRPDEDLRRKELGVRC